MPRSVGTSVERRITDCSRYAVDLAEKGVWLSDRDSLFALHRPSG